MILSVLGWCEWGVFGVDLGVLLGFCWVELASWRLFNEILVSAKYPFDADWMRS